jgi:hypothetical protein
MGIPRNTMNQNQKQKTLKTREEEAYELFQAGAISKDYENDDVYHVRSQKDPNVFYTVTCSLNACTCKDYERNCGDPKMVCKHVIATLRASQLQAIITLAKLQTLANIGGAMAAVGEAKAKPKVEVVA